MNLSKFIAIVALGSTVALSFYSCKDMGDTPPSPPPPRLAASVSSVTLAPGGQTSVTISGGNPPYTISRRPDTLVAQATLAGSVLTLRAAASNLSRTTSVRIRDTDPSSSSDSPTHEEQEIEIPISIAATAVSFSADIQPIFNANGCVGCHGGNGGLFLTSGQSYANLVNVQAQAGCTTQKRVQPGDASVSVLYKRVASSDCGSRMPKNNPSLSATDIAKIRDWIGQGALNN